MRVIIADDAALIREGLRHSLRAHGVEVIGEAQNAVELLRAVAASSPDAVITDLRMPPSRTDEGLRAAMEIRRTDPDVAVLVLSQYEDVTAAEALLECSPRSIGYLLKERITETGQLLDTLRRIIDGEIVIDPGLVQAVLGRRRAPDPLVGLTPRERDVLTLMAEGRSNSGIGDKLYLSPKTVERYIAQVFDKLDLATHPSINRRVLAVLTALGRGGRDEPRRLEPDRWPGNSPST